MKSCFKCKIAVCCIKNLMVVRSFLSFQCQDQATVDISDLQGTPAGQSWGSLICHRCDDGFSCKFVFSSFLFLLIASLLNRIYQDVQKWWCLGTEPIHLKTQPASNTTKDSGCVISCRELRIGKSLGSVDSKQKAVRSTYFSMSC